MSWDLIVMRVPPGLKRIEDLPSDFQPETIGTREEVISRIKEAVPTANFSDPNWGVIDDAGCSIEVSLGSQDSISSFSLHVHEGDASIHAIARILGHLRLQAIDCQTSALFDAGPAAMESFRQWKSYRDRVIAGYGGGSDESSRPRS